MAGLHLLLSRFEVSIQRISRVLSVYFNGIFCAKVVNECDVERIFCLLDMIPGFLQIGQAIADVHLLDSNSSPVFQFKVTL